MDRRFAQMLRAVQLHYQENGLQEGDHVVILCNTENYQPLVQAYHSAAVALGAEVVLLEYLARPPLSGLPEFVVETAANTDVLVDLSFVTWAYTDSWAKFAELQEKTGVRRIRGQTWGREEDVETLINTPPDPELVARTERAREMIDGTQTVHLTSDLGTKFTVARGDPNERTSYAPPGQVAFAPPEGSARGVIYFKGGIRMQAPALEKHMIYEPVRMEFENGKLIEIDRSTGPSVMLDDWFRSHGDMNSYQFAHINLGLDHRVRLANLDNISLHFNYGGVMFGIGANYDPILFGNTGVKCQSHIDMALVDADYSLGEQKILEGGEFTSESGLRLPSRIGR